MALECGKTIEVINEVDLDWLDLRNFEKEDEVVVVDFETLLEDYDRIKKSLPESPQKIRKYEANKVKPIITDTAKEITTITLDDEDVVDKQDECIHANVEAEIEVTYESPKNETQSFLEKVLLQEDRNLIDVNGNEKASSDGSKAPMGSPTSSRSVSNNNAKPENCFQHVIPSYFYKKSLMKRFPYNLPAKRLLNDKFGEPSRDHNNGYFKILPDTIKPEYVYRQPIDVDEMTPPKGVQYISYPKGIYSCHFCKKAYKQYAALRRHYKNKHSYIWQ